MTTLVLKDNQLCSATIAPVDAAGNPAVLDGVPTWESSDPTIATVGAAADGLSATITAVGPVGVAVVTIKGDADLGSGVTEISDTINVSVEAGQATGFGVTLGTPTDKPAAT